MRLETFEALGAYERGATLRNLVETMAGANEEWLRLFPLAPDILRAVTYVDARDEWRDIAALLRMREGDCKDIIAARVAQLRAIGIPAMARVIMFDDPADAEADIVYHIVAQYPARFLPRSGLTREEAHAYVRPFGPSDVHEDTSKLLGMP